MLQTFKYKLLNNWNVIRIVRLILSIIIIVQSLQMHDMLFGLLGVFFLYQALSNTGCCAMNTCAPNIANTKEEEIEFVEIKNKTDGNQS